MKQNGVVCLPGPALLFFIFRFEYLISGPKSYRDVREASPQAPVVQKLDSSIYWINHYPAHSVIDFYSTFP